MMIKMASKHKRIDVDEYLTKLCDEFNKIKDIRTLILTGHLFVEYCVNERILRMFKDGEIIVNDNGFGFYKKFQLLKASGLFNDQKHIERNIEIINQLRNKCAHCLFIEDLQEDMKKSIREMKLSIRTVVHDEQSFKDNYKDEFRVKTSDTILFFLMVE
jgi:hypothetical protein